MYTNNWRLCVGATSNVVRTMTKAASPSREGQSMCGQYEKIFGYPHRSLCAPFYKVSAAEGQAREAAYYSFRSLLSNSGDWKKHHEVRFTSIRLGTNLLQ